MTFGDYLAMSVVYWTRHPEQRFGQALVNVMRSLNSHFYLADKLMFDLGIDPWDDQSQVDRWLKEAWERW